MSETGAAIGNDPLSEGTRRVRRNLLAASFVGLAMAWADLTPTSISALGVEVAQIDKDRLWILVAAIVLYELVSFGLYGKMETGTWLSFRPAVAKDFRKASQETNDDMGEMLKQMSDQLGWLSTLRVWWDYRAPLAIGLLTLVILIGGATGWLPPESTTR